MKKVQVRVSVVVPAYNVREHIAEAISSVRAQNFDDVEIIVVDDGSSDGTADFVEREFPDVRLFRKENGGAATARNLGMREARGEYIAFLDADDVWLTGKLKAQIFYLDQRPDLGLVCGGFSFWTADEKGLFPDPCALHSPIVDTQVEPDYAGWGYHKLLLSNYVWTSTVVMRRSLVERIGYYDERLRLGQDYEFWLRASRETEIHRLGAVMALYRRHSGSATVRTGGSGHAVAIVEDAVRRWGLASPNGESIEPRQLAARIFSMRLRVGYGLYQKGRFTTAKEELREASKLRPLNLRVWIYRLLCTLRAERD